VAVPVLFVLFFGAVVTLMVVIVVVSFISAKKRREALSLLATQRGWRFAARDDAWVDRFDGAPFGLGRDRQALNVLTGAYDGRPFVAFDYRYSTTETSTDAEGHPQTRTEVHPYSVLGVDTGAGFPDLSVTPEGFLGRIAGRLTNTDIELESEEFNRAFTVRSADRKFATDVLHPRMMEFLLQTSAPRGPDTASSRPSVRSPTSGWRRPMSVRGPETATRRTSRARRSGGGSSGTAPSGGPRSTGC
jgi:hypothetical protein